MKKIRLFGTAVGLVSAMWCSAASPSAVYEPSPEIIQAQKEFSDARFGIFIHWGVYSMFGQGEWYLNYGLDAKEYAKAASGFYPANFNAQEWVKAIKDSGAKYITFTSRHHDSFSMWDTEQSDFNIVDATPWGRDVIGELSKACQDQGVKLHLYYSHLDWSRPEYPVGRTGTKTGRDSTKTDWPTYYNFMNSQLTELLTNYGPIGAIWFDGWWDHDQDKTPFDWQLDEQYALIHKLQPSCLVGNNHHQTPFAGEDIQIFERDLPGENTAGLSGQAVSQLPLETCQTMNGMWGYKIADQNYKSTEELVRYIVKTAGMGANLLLNIGPQPNGELPAAALDRLKGIGEWMNRYGETIYGTKAGDFPAQAWGTSTRKDNKLYVHVMSAEGQDIHLPTTRKVKSAMAYDDRKPVKFTRNKKEGGATLHLENVPEATDYIIEVITD